MRSVVTRNPDLLLRQAAALHGEGDLQGAERLYRRVLALRPEDPNALNLLGVALRQQGRIEPAIASIRRALALRPDSPVFRASLGGALAEAGQLADAIAEMRRALAVRPDDPVTLRNLGQALAAQGDPHAAIAPLERAVALGPAAPEPLLALAHARRETGDREGAILAADLAMRRAAAAPAIAAQARFLLAALGREALPDRAPAAYVRDLFDQYAPRFDADLTGRLGYRTPALLAALLVRHGITPARRLRVMDLGCGTGLSGEALAPFARRLEGLDLSPRMLAEAARKGRYDALYEADLLDHLPRHRTAWDLVAAADVLNYLGDLGPALTAIAGALAPGGHAAVSIEAGEGAPVALGDGLRFRHDPADVAARAAAGGLVEVAQERTALREERGAPVDGVLFLWLKPA
jgi:predicted TPR repeat methyltransferase